jgi:uncharacterized protein (TIGR03435 family)
MRRAIPVLLVLNGLCIGQVFDVASVKPAPPDDGGAMSNAHGGPGSADPGQVTFRNISLMNLLGRAFSDSFRIDGPGWLDNERYDVTAKMPPDTTADQFSAMLRNLLVERFQMKAHHETRDLPAYDLVIAKGGLKMKEAVADTGGPPVGASEESIKVGPKGFPQLTRPGMSTAYSNESSAVRLTARAQPMWRLVGILRTELQKPVIDKTGLNGKYDFTLEYAPIGGAASSPPTQGNPPQAEIGAPSIAYAIPSLGLISQETKEPLDVLVVESVQKTPAEN